MPKERKHGRNADGCKTYYMNGTREKNKARKILRHLRRYPDDETAQAAFKRLPTTAQNAAIKALGIQPDTLVA